MTTTPARLQKISPNVGTQLRNRQAITDAGLSKSSAHRYEQTDRRAAADRPDATNARPALTLTNKSAHHMAKAGHSHTTPPAQSRMRLRPPAHLNEGQRAILLAIAYPEPSKGGRGHTKPLEISKVDIGDLSRARAIVKWCPDMVEDILARGSGFQFGVRGS